MKKIQIFIDHDIIIRHFLFNDTFKELNKNYNLQFVFPIDDKRIKTDINNFKLSSIKLIPVDRDRLGKLRYLSKVQTINIARKKPAYKFIKKLWKMVFCFKDYYKMWLKSLPIVFNIYKNKIIKEIGNYPELEKVINNFNPDIIIHPSVLDGLFISDLALITHKKNIPFLVLMNSWDNPSNKALVIKPPDYLVVWGEQTKNHAIKFLGMDPENIKIMGAAQFEIYSKKPTKTRKDICNEIGINHNKKLILYAGSSKSINEINHLLALEESINKGFLKNCHVIFRPHPWRAPSEDEPDFFEIKWENVSMDPAMMNYYNSPKKSDEKKINLTDYMDTHNLLSAINLLISNVSTILLEAAMHGKPIICMVSDEDIKKSEFLKVTMISIYFQELLKILEVPRCKNYKELPKLCENMLSISALSDFEKKQKEKSNFFVDQGLEPYSIGLNKLVNEIFIKWNKN